MNVGLYGLLVAVVGMSIVFVCLVLLIAIISLQAGVFGMVGGKKKAPAQKKEAPAPVPAPVVVGVEDEDEIAAVIAAAVAMMEESGNGLRVKSIRRIGSNAPAWNAAGRREYLGSRY